MMPGSLRAGVISWLRVCLGLGIFSIPFCFYSLGIFYGVLFLILAALSSYINYKIIFQNSDELDSCEYFFLVNNTLGGMYFKIFKISLLVDLSSNYWVFPLLSWKLFVYITGHYNWITFKYINRDNIQIDEYDTYTIFIRVWFLIGCFLLSIYFLLVKKLENMKFISILFIIFIIYFFVWVVVEGSFNLASFNLDFENIIFKKITIRFFVYISNWILSFYTQPFMLDIKNELFNPNEKRCKKIYKGCTYFVFFIYLVLGIIGFLGYQNDMNDIILISKHHYIFKHLFFYPICIFIIILIISTPIYNPSLRVVIFDIYKIKNTTLNYNLISLLPYIFWIIIASIYPNIINIFGLVGGVIYNFNGFITPLWMKIKMIREVKGKNIYYYLFSILLFIHILIMIGTIVATFY